MSIPKFGSLTNPRVEILKEIKRIKNTKFDFVEIGIEWPEGSVEVLDAKKEKILNFLEKNNFPAIAHTAWWMEFGSPYEEIRKFWVKLAKEKISVAKKLKIELINFHAYTRQSAAYKKYERKIVLNFIRSMDELVEFAKNKNMRVMLENGGEDNMINFHNFSAIINSVKGLNVHLDVGHAFIYGGMQNIHRYILTFKDKIVHIHLHDNHGESDEHLPIGSGFINHRNVVAWLKQIGYDKTVTFEVFTSEKDLLKSRELIQKLWNKP